MSMTTFGRPGTSLLGFGTSMVGRTRRPGAYREFRRRYQTWAVASFGPYHKELTDAGEATKAVRLYFDLIREAEYHKRPENCMRLLLWPEFAFNVRRITTDEETITVDHGAGQPISLPVLQALQATFLEEMSKLPPGYLAMVGGIAHDTGEIKANGKKRGINLGLLMESGGMNPHLLYTVFSKHHRSNLDEWPSDFEVDTGTGPFDYTVEDPKGGRPVQFTGFICVDAADGPYTEKMKKADLLAISSYGTPYWRTDWSKKALVSPVAEVAVADSVVGDDPESARVGTFTRAPVPKYPALSGLYKLAGDGWLGDALLMAYEQFLSLDRTEVMSTVQGFQKLPLTKFTKDELWMSTIQDRPLPPLFPGVGVTETEKPSTADKGVD